jgi:hypothetical protein
MAVARHFLRVTPGAVAGDAASDVFKTPLPGRGFRTSTHYGSANDGMSLANAADAARRDGDSHYSRQAHNIEAERRCCEIRLRAERKAGDLLRQMDKLKGRPGKASDATTLSDLGITARSASINFVAPFD